MNDAVTLPLYLDLAAVFLGGLSGSLHAVRRGFAVTGLVAMAVAAGLGGGILRDVLLQTRPVALTQPWYLPTVLAAAGIGFFFGSLVGRFKQADRPAWMRCGWVCSPWSAPRRLWCRDSRVSPPSSWEP